MPLPVVPTIYADEEQAEEMLPRALVHIRGTGQSGMDTICGHVDRTTWRWKEGDTPRLRKVNCRTCLGIWTYVQAHRLP